ncbi:MAG TPA: hypothetical protein DCS87_11550 [Rheinheimera sp.]|nr:hypothetical protein [Rheinheimera sp.]
MSSFNRLYCDKSNSVVAGVCSGIAATYGHDRSLVRLVAILSLFVLPGITFMAYLIAAIVLPSRRNYLD